MSEENKKDAGSETAAENVPPADAGRIAQLELEVARLRAQLDDRGSELHDQGKTPGSVLATAEDPPLKTGGFTRKSSRLKIGIVVLVVVVAGAGFFLAIFSALSKGFDSLAGKAAEALVPPKREAAQVRPKPAPPKGEGQRPAQVKDSAAKDAPKSEPPDKAKEAPANAPRIPGF